VTASPDGAAAAGGEPADVTDGASPNGGPAGAVPADPIGSGNPGAWE
jgi:hypothetical protein